MALSTDAVATLISNLQKTGYFRTSRSKRPTRMTGQRHAGIPVHADLRKGEVLRGGKTMANFSEMSGLKQWALLVRVGGC